MEHDFATDVEPPDEAWLFAQRVLGNSLPRIVDPAVRARAQRAELERRAAYSGRAAEELRALDAAEDRVRNDREVLEWAATISSRAADELRGLRQREAEQREGWRRSEQYFENDHTNLTEWSEADHPRQPRGASTGGQFAPKGGGIGGGGLLGQVIQRNQVIGDLSRVMTPSMRASSRLAVNLQSATRLPREVTQAAGAGLVTGSKAIVNGSATAVRSTATLGLKSQQWELIGVTQEDRQRGYDTAVAISTASGQILIAVGTSGLATTLSQGGTVARTASGTLVAYDAAGNAVATVQAAYDASQNGIHLENGLRISGSALGLTSNIQAVRGLRHAHVAAQLARVEAYVATRPRTPTPTKTVANRYEIAHTGPHNYRIAGGGTKFDIDGYRGTTILETKHVGNAKSSPYVPGSACYEPVRTKALNDFRDELERARSIIRSGETPFKSIEIITNTPESKALFEGMLKEAGVPGMVRLAI